MKVRALILGKTVLNTSVLGKMTRKTEKAPWYGMTAANMKVIGRTMSAMVKAHLNMPMETSMWVTGKKTCSMVRAFTFSIRVTATRVLMYKVNVRVKASTIMPVAISM